MLFDPKRITHFYSMNITSEKNQALLMNSVAYYNIIIVYDIGILKYCKENDEQNEESSILENSIFKKSRKIFKNSN